MFKDDVKDKSQIRKMLGDVTYSVIDLFEKWWEKYGTSLAQINSAIKESEVLMHGFLRELEYE